MKARAKSSNTPCPIWIYGEYITTPPRRPNGEVRPKGHYIDKGGYPGTNVYVICNDTLCRQTVAVDRLKRNIYEHDILLFETEEDISYFIVEDMNTAIDIINGEILDIAKLQAADIKIIGNLIDYPEFIESMRYHVDNSLNIPYLPELDVMSTPLPFFKLTCLKCGHITLACCYKSMHKGCGGYFTADFASKINRERKKKRRLHNG